MTTPLSNLKSFLRNKEDLHAQFIKYMVCGGISVGVDAAAFYLLAWLVFPCLQQSDPVAQLLRLVGFQIRDVDAETLIRNYWIVKVICFLLSNAVVYVLNVLYVFEGGRHHRVKEVSLFFAVSVSIFLASTLLGAYLINTCGWNTSYSYLGMLMLGILLNYTLRKFIVFKR
jgi:putative flippase GtrA